MSAVTTPQTGAGYAAATLTKAPPWHGLIAWDMLFNSLTTGLFLVAALAELTAPRIFAPVCRVAYPLALFFLVADLVCLVLDLGDPWRFHHMLRVFKPTSPMSLGTWCLTAYSLPLILAAACSLFWWPNLENSAVSIFYGVRMAILILGLFPALGSAVYKGVLLSTSSQPGWRKARWLGAYLTQSALMFGCAEMLVLSLFLEPGQAVNLLRISLAIVLVLKAFLAVLLFGNLRAALSRSFSRAQFTWFRGFTFLIGSLLPLVLLLASNNTAWLCTAAFLLLADGLLIRTVLITMPRVGTRNVRSELPA